MEVHTHNGRSFINGHYPKQKLSVAKAIKAVSENYCVDQTILKEEVYKDYQFVTNFLFWKKKVYTDT